MRALLSVLGLMLILTALAPAAPAADFDHFFVDATMRVDYYHIGNAAEEFITLDQVYRQGTWAGSLTHLTDPFNLGRYAVRVYDAASGRLIFARGFDSYFGEYRTTATAAKGVRRTYQESALIPFPRRPIRFTIAGRDAHQKLQEIFSQVIDPAAITINRDPLDRGVVVIDGAIGGDPHHKVDLAVLGEGYTAAEEGKFRRDLKRFVDTFFSQEPYHSLREDFNIRGVFKASDQSGCDEPGHGVYRNTALGATFDSLGSERYMLTEENRRVRDLAAHVPYDLTIIMVNHSRYGGGGIYNLYSTFSTDNSWHDYLILHEFGHAFAGLADEYYTSSTAYNDFYPRGTEPLEANITALLDPANLKWKDLATPGTPIPTPWDKADYDKLDNAYQQRREELNEEIGRLARAGAPAAEVEAKKAEAEKLAADNNKQVEAFLSTRRFKGKVGAFEGAGYSSTGLYRPMVDCIMFSRGAKPYCKVCEQAVRRTIRYYTE